MARRTIFGIIFVRCGAVAGGGRLRAGSTSRRSKLGFYSSTDLVDKSGEDRPIESPEAQDSKTSIGLPVFWAQKSTY
jgi:hypothetical protein